VRLGETTNKSQGWRSIGVVVGESRHWTCMTGMDPLSRSGDPCLIGRLIELLIGAPH
jgi:hypothetical protein